MSHHIRHLATVSAVLLLGVLATRASSQTIFAGVQLDTPTTSSYFYGQVHTYIPIPVQSEHWVSISGAGANQNYSAHANCLNAVTGWNQQGVYNNLFSVTTDGFGGGRAINIIESGSINVGVSPGVNTYTATGTTNITDKPQGFAFLGSNPNVVDVGFTIAGDD